MTYLIDTTAIYGYLVTFDKFHQQADLVISEKPELLIPFQVVEECAALLHHRFSKKDTLVGLHTFAYKKKATRIHYPTSKEDNEIWKLYQKLPNKIDYVDASLIYYSQKWQLPIFTYDKQFYELKSPRLKLVGHHNTS